MDPQRVGSYEVNAADDGNELIVRFRLTSNYRAAPRIEYEVKRKVVSIAEDGNVNIEATIAPVSVLLDKANHVHSLEHHATSIGDSPADPYIIQGHNAATFPTRTCFNYTTLGHIASECPKNFICTRCGMVGHFSFQCTGDVRNHRSHICGGQGHTKWDCDLRQYPQRPDPQCRNCNEFGHIAAECSNDQNMDHV
ncbi:Zinc finger CCHC retroviral-type [Fusarium albosuccineum]|uniref:Zinc finger CCHC retroviral-type n=1 Tax=Fusarium albosuccineum TaxID=1237068 RepID=A0A8H4PLT1_9HYPO|nr:Zinc finger CCHC retroviral-type [Fusarium albosuccineum]